MLGHHLNGMSATTPTKPSVVNGSNTSVTSSLEQLMLLRQHQQTEMLLSQLKSPPGGNGTPPIVNGLMTSSATPTNPLAIQPLISTTPSSQQQSLDSALLLSLYSSGGMGSLIANSAIANNNLQNSTNASFNSCKNVSTSVSNGRVSSSITNSRDELINKLSQITPPPISCDVRTTTPLFNSSPIVPSSSSSLAHNDLSSPSSLLSNGGLLNGINRFTTQCNANLINNMDTVTSVPSNDNNHTTTPNLWETLASRLAAQEYLMRLQAASVASLPLNTSSTSPTPPVSTNISKSTNISNFASIDSLSKSSSCQENQESITLYPAEDTNGDMDQQHSIPLNSSEQQATIYSNLLAKAFQQASSLSSISHQNIMQRANSNANLIAAVTNTSSTSLTPTKATPVKAPRKRSKVSDKSTNNGGSNSVVPTKRSKGGGGKKGHKTVTAENNSVLDINCNNSTAIVSTTTALPLNLCVKPVSTGSITQMDSVSGFKPQLTVDQQSSGKDSSSLLDQHKREQLMKAIESIQSNSESTVSTAASVLQAALIVSKLLEAQQEIGKSGNDQQTSQTMSSSEIHPLLNNNGNVVGGSDTASQISVNSILTDPYIG